MPHPPWLSVGVGNLLLGSIALTDALGLLGGALVCIAALGVCRILRQNNRKRREHFAAVIAFVDGLKCHISNTGCAIDGFMARESVPLLSSIGLYREYRRLGELCAAFRAVEGELMLPKGAVDGVSRLFEGLGRLDQRDVLARLSGGLDELRESAAASKEADERLLRTVSVYSAAVGAGLMIFLL